jgi:DNA-binding MarR family transcriptional regulator
MTDSPDENVPPQGSTPAAPAGADAGMLVVPVRTGLHRIDRLLREARHALGADVTVQRLLILLNVYLNEGLSQTELLRQLDGTSVTALSRNLADLSAWTSRKRPGPDLLELRTDPMNLRRKTVHLTETGRALVERLSTLAEREQEADGA